MAVNKFLIALLLLPVLGNAQVQNFSNAFVVSSTSSGGGGATSPGGSSGQVQYNNAGSFGGMTNSVVSGNNISFGGNISAPSATFTNVADTALTSGSLVWTTTAGLLSSDASATYNGAGIVSLGGVSATGVVSASRVMLGDGTAAAPSMAFINSTGTGCYRQANNVMTCVVGGAAMVRITGGGTGINTTAALNAIFGVSGTALVTSWTTLNSTSTPVGPLTVPGLANNAGTNQLCYNTTTGAVTYSSTCTVSDETLKTNIAARTGGLARIAALRPVTYQWREPEDFGVEGSGTKVGFIAQEVAPVIPQAVSRQDDGKLNLVMYNLMPDMVLAIQELKARVELLEEKQALVQ